MAHSMVEHTRRHIGPVHVAPVRAAALALAMMGSGLTGGCAGLHPIRLAAPDPAMVAVLDGLSAGPCNGPVASALAGAGIPASQVDGLVYGLYRGLEDIIGYDAWVRLKNQPGSIVVRLDAECRPTQIYARGGARLPDRGAP